MDARARGKHRPAAMSNSTNSTATADGNQDSVNSYIYGVLAALAGSTLQVCDFGRASERREAILCVVGVPAKTITRCGWNAGIRPPAVEASLLDRRPRSRGKVPEKARAPVSRIPFPSWHVACALPSLSMCAYVCARKCNVYAHMCSCAHRDTPDLSCDVMCICVK